ncbi:MAG: tetratricopeptide repeat protein [Gemmatimonadaceae bacterium]
MVNSVTGLRAAFEQIKAQVEEREMRDEPELKASLMDVYRSVDTSLAEMGRLKDDIRELVDRWKSRRPPAPAMAPQFAGKRPMVHEDHIGASTFLEKGWSRISLGDYEGAEQALQRAMELAPTNAEGQSLLGWAQMLQDKLDAALLNFQYVLGREPTNALARINVGYICLKKGIFGEAIEHLSKALRQNDDARARLYANFYLGLVYTEREMYDDAQIFFERSIKLGPNLVEAYFELGHAQWLSGDRVCAIATWKRGAAVNKFNPWSVKCAEIGAAAEGGVEPRRAWLSKGE